MFANKVLNTKGEKRIFRRDGGPSYLNIYIYIYKRERIKVCESFVSRFLADSGRRKVPGEQR